MLRTTRRVVLIVLLSAVTTGAWAQVDKDQRVTFDFRDTDIKTVMQALGQQTGIQYAFDGDIAKTVTVSLRNQTIDAALKVVLSSADLTSVYDEATDVYHIKTKPKRATEPRLGAGRGALPTVSISPLVPTRRAPAVAGTAGADEDEEQEEIIRLIRVRFSDPLLFSDGVGIGGSMSSSSSGFGGRGGNSGGYGNNSRGNSRNSSGYGSSSGSSSSGYGSSSGSSYGGY